MLVIPFDRRIDWKRPPLITLALIALNVLVFFMFQGREDERMAEAVGYYYDSGLHAVELPAYRDVLLARGEQAFVQRWESRLAEPRSPWLWRMLADDPFMQQLRAGEIIGAAAANYDDWRSWRSRFEAKMNRVTSFRWGFTPAQASVLTAITHQFLHGGVGHLLGNMLFLLAVGFLVEGALGRGVYLGSYLLGGLGAVGLFYLFSPDSGIPLVGASGAVSGLMGMYAVLFGRRRISFFYYIGVYFDYVKAPAFVLLLLWLGYQLLEYFWLSPDSNVAYMAHIGGLITGALIALSLKLWLPRRVDQAYLRENDAKAESDALRQTAAGHMQRLDFDKATPIIETLLAEQPRDHELLKSLLACVRFDSAAEAYHRAAHRIFQLTEADPASDAWVLETYRNYVARAKPRVRLPAPVVRALTARFIRAGELAEAERLVRVMLRHPLAFADAPTLLARLADSLIRDRQPAQAHHYFRLLLEHYPTAPEAVIARRALHGVT